MTAAPTTPSLPLGGAHQTTVPGSQTLSQKYGNFGVRGMNRTTSASRARVLLLGEGGVGKTSMFRDHPGALILSFDLSPLPVIPGAVPPVWSVFPSRDDTGQAIGPNGPVEMNYELFIEMKNTLIQAAIRKQPRPETIAFDSINGAIPFLQNWIVRKMGKTSWKELDGRDAWGIVYDEIAAYGRDLNAHGYGFYWIGHVKPEDIVMGENVHKTYELAISDKVFGRIHPSADEVLGVSMERMVRTSKQKHVIGGRTIERPITQEESVPVVYGKTGIWTPICKSRSNIQRVPLNSSQPWAAWSEGFAACIAAQKPQQAVSDETSGSSSNTTAAQGDSQ